jgi:hypothetical protein
MTTSERIMRAALLAAPIYAANGWKWGRYSDGPRGAHVPDVGEIAMTIRRLYGAIPGRSRVRSGRLTVVIDEEDGEITVSVELGVLREGTIPTLTLEGETVSGLRAFEAMKASRRAAA